ncbi:hypothetical protein E2562_035408 [Oryza meyeriana var. granulata]|uniref:Uncharacterized protein n=1 Tax=Oryza meyeriana var. granulata TaxID=110450 RepID=A0A6G1F1S9_9ORYZ|nr:hypothetical protein E2562_035408 [Oryza meyeriana var. granulata]
METPLSTRRITRSMAKNAAADSRAKATTPRDAAHQRPALHDITNDSPIVGLAAAGLHTPASTAAKTRPRPRRTPGSGEALLRGQVKTLLQKVDEDACAAPSPVVRIHALLGVARSPAHLLAPTPANTPLLAAAPPHAFTMTAPCVLEEEDLLRKLQVIAAALPPPPAAQAEENLGECNRALVFEDSPGKSGLSNAGSVVSSSLVFQDSSSDRLPDDDSSSAWSIQVNASSEKGDEDTFTEQEEEEEWPTEEDDDDDDECFDDLCEGMSKMSVFGNEEQEKEEKKVGLPAFQGKHTRFIYDSDGEMEREDVAHVPVENCTMVLRGLPYLVPLKCP